MQWSRWLIMCLPLSLGACQGVHLPQTQPVAPKYYPAASQVLIVTGGNDISLVRSPTRQVVVQLVNNAQRPPYLSSWYKNNNLTLKWSATEFFNKTNSRIVIALPDNVQQLTLQGNGELNATALPRGLQRLVLRDSSGLILKGQYTHLQWLSLDHVKQLRIDGLNSPHLQLQAESSGPITLNGMVGLESLNLKKTAATSVTWVNSPRLVVNASGSDRIFLAGAVDLLIGTVHDKGRLDAKYLRAQKAFVNTDQQAVAEVSVLDSLNAYAQGSSNIYYYHQPKLIGHYYQDHGSVLYMGEKAPPCLSPECAPMPNSQPG